MGLSMMSSGKGTRRSVDTEINLIPMIDLLIVNISFLLITAVWTQLSRLNVTQQMPGSDVATEKPPEDKVKLSLRISETGFVLAAGAEAITIEKRGDDYDYKKLHEELKAVKERDPERRDINVMPENGVIYKNLIMAMDVALQEDFPELSVSDGSSL